MKIYVKSSMSRANKMTHTKAMKKFSDEDIRRKAQEDTYRGESMRQIWININRDPNIEFRDTDTEGLKEIFYKGENVGWVDYNKGMGDFNRNKYTQLKRDAKARPDYGKEEEVEEVKEIDEDEEFDEDEEY